MMFPSASAVSGLETNVLRALIDFNVNGLMWETALPVLLFTFQTVPAAPGTYRYPLLNAGWNTGSEVPRPLIPILKFVPLGSGFQSVKNVQAATGSPCSQR